MIRPANSDTALHTSFPPPPPVAVPPQINDRYTAEHQELLSRLGSNPDLVMDIRVIEDGTRQNLAHVVISN